MGNKSESNHQNENRLNRYIQGKEKKIRIRPEGSMIKKWESRKEEQERYVWVKIVLFCLPKSRIESDLTSSMDYIIDIVKKIVDIILFVVFSTNS